MSKNYPVVVVTGSSGAGTTTVKIAFEHIFIRNRINAAYINGDSFHLHTRQEFLEEVKKAESKGNHHFSHFGPDSNDFRALEELFASYGKNGTGQFRNYIHTKEEAEIFSDKFNINLEDGQFTPHESIPKGTDLLLYEGLHGMVKGDGYDVTRHVDLALGVVPVVNIEWIQKIHRDGKERGYSKEEVIDTILRRMPDYVNHVTPQFSRTDINFQRVATVDTSNPFVARDIPTLDESFVIIHFRNRKKFNPDFVTLLALIQGSFMSRRNTMVVPGGKMGMAIEVIIGPIIERLLKKRKIPAA